MTPSQPPELTELDDLRASLRIESRENDRLREENAALRLELRRLRTLLHSREEHHAIALARARRGDGLAGWRRLARFLWGAG